MVSWSYVAFTLCNFLSNLLFICLLSKDVGSILFDVTCYIEKKDFGIVAYKTGSIQKPNLTACYFPFYISILL